MRTSVAATASAGGRTGRDFKRPEVRRREAVNVYLKVWKRKEAVLEEGKKTQKSDFFLSSSTDHALLSSAVPKKNQLASSVPLHDGHVG